MPRLPTPGSDTDNWGVLLNEFLRVSHREDGTLKNCYTALNVRDFGAKGDGQTDDQAAIQNAIDTAGQAGGGTVYIPPGKYNLSTPGGNRAALVLRPSNVRLIGDGYASHLHTTSVVEGRASIAIVVSMLNGIVEHTEIAGLHLTSAEVDNLADLDGAGIITTKEQVKDLAIHDCFLDTRSLVGFTNDSTTELLRFYNNHILATGSHGIYIAGPSSSDVWIQNNKFDGVRASSPEFRATGIALKNVDGLYLTNNSISGYPYSAINPADFPNTRLFIIGNTIRMNWGTKVLIANNLFDNIDDTGVFCAAAHPVDQIRIINNQFTDIRNSRAITVEKFNGQRPSNVSIMNNWCEECSQGIVTDGVAGVLRISRNQLRRSVNEGKSGIKVLDSDSADTLVDYNIVRGYADLEIVLPAVQSSNLINGVFKGNDPTALQLSNIIGG
jgi:hypothetical protein